MTESLYSGFFSPSYLSSTERINFYLHDSDIVAREVVVGGGVGLVMVLAHNQLQSMRLGENGSHGKMNKLKYNLHSKSIIL